MKDSERESRRKRGEKKKRNKRALGEKGWWVGTPEGGFWKEMLNSDARDYGGGGQGSMGGVEAAPIPFRGHPFSLNLTLPHLGAAFFKGQQ